MKDGEISIADRRQKNLNEGRPARAGFPWREKELAGLLAAYGRGASIDMLAEHLERPASAIVSQLIKAGVMKVEAVMKDKQKRAAKHVEPCSKSEHKATATANRRSATASPGGDTAAMHEGMRRKLRPLVVDDAPGPKYDEMVRRFGATGKQG